MLDLSVTKIFFFAAAVFQNSYASSEYGRLAERITEEGLNKYFCHTDYDCNENESCEKVCLWSFKTDYFVGCKVTCVIKAYVPPPPKKHCYNDHDCGYNAECHYGECKCKYGFKEALDHYGVFKCEPIHQYPEEQPSYQQPEPKHCYSTNDCDYGQKCCKKTVYQKTYHGTEISYTYECADYCQHKN